MTVMRFKRRKFNIIFRTSSKEREKRLDSIINLKSTDLDSNRTSERWAVSNALLEVEENVRDFVLENQQLKKALENAKCQIFETLT